jgi:hypothetical protein
LISFIRVALCICSMGYGRPWYGLAPSFILMETGACASHLVCRQRASRNRAAMRAAYLVVMALGEDKCPSGRFALSYLASSTAGFSSKEVAYKFNSYIVGTERETKISHSEPLSSNSLSCTQHGKTSDKKIETMASKPIVAKRSFLETPST